MSLVLFSAQALHALNTIDTLDVDISAAVENWTTRGDSAEFSLCDNAVCVRTHSKGRSVLIIEIPLDNLLSDGSNWLEYQVIVEPLPEVVPVNVDGRPSFIVARAVSSSAKRFKNIGSVIYLNRGAGKKKHRRVIDSREQVHFFQAHVVIRDGVAVRISDMKFSVIEHSMVYLALRALIFLAWFILIGLLTLKVLAAISFQSRLALAGVFVMALFIGASGYAPTLSRKLGSYLTAHWDFQLQQLVPMSALLMLASIHFIFHYVLTVALAMLLRRTSLTYTQIIVLNLCLAIAIECVQMGIPNRSADLLDIAAAMVGVCLGLLSAYLGARVRRASGKNA